MASDRTTVDFEGLSAGLKSAKDENLNLEELQTNLRSNIENAFNQSGGSALSQDLATAITNNFEEVLNPAYVNLLNAIDVFISNINTSGDILSDYTSSEASSYKTA